MRFYYTTRMPEFTDRVTVWLGRQEKSSGRLLGYEEAAGISTPSHEQVPAPGQQEVALPETRLCPLAENDRLKLVRVAAYPDPGG